MEAFETSPNEDLGGPMTAEPEELMGDEREAAIEGAMAHDEVTAKVGELRERGFRVREEIGYAMQTPEGLKVLLPYEDDGEGYGTLFYLDGAETDVFELEELDLECLKSCRPEECHEACHIQLLYSMEDEGEREEPAPSYLARDPSAGSVVP